MFAKNIEMSFVRRNNPKFRNLLLACLKLLFLVPFFCISFYLKKRIYNLCFQQPQALHLQ